ncbi:MAG TPA: FmdB family zinc ribbon protein [Phycisphaerae bacterium]
MPTYEYECRRCGKVVEVFQSMTDSPLKRLPEPCPVCGERTPAQRLIGRGGGVIFKGSGFYETDYRSESYKQGAKAETESSKPTAADTKTDKSTDTTAKPAPPAKEPKKSKPKKTSAD